MRVSSITRRKLLLLSKERSNDFKHHLSSLTTNEREELCDFLKSDYIQKRNIAIVFTLGQTLILFKYDAVGLSLIFDLSAAFYIAGVNDAYVKTLEMIDEVETNVKNKQ